MPAKWLLGTLLLTGAIPARLLGQKYPAPCDAPELAMVSIGHCFDVEYSLADSAVSVAFRLTLQKLQPEGQRLLREQQRQWLAQRSAIKPDPAAGNHPSFFVLPTLISMTRARAFELHHRLLTAEQTDQLPMPIQVTFRLAAAGRGFVLQMRNTGSELLQVTARFYNPTSDEIKTQLLSIRPSALVEVGWNEGWTFESGHLVQLLQGRLLSRLVPVP